MTSRQLTVVDALKAGSEEFTTMRQLAMRFRGLFRGGSLEKLDEWLYAIGRVFELGALELTVPFENLAVVFDKPQGAVEIDVRFTPIRLSPTATTCRVRPIA